MNANHPTSPSVHDQAPAPKRPVLAGSLALFSLAPITVMAQGFGGADAKVCGFFDNVNGLLNMASIAVVTIAIIFAGYQIAFAHKRISDVAPILVGGLLIGAAAQIARMLLGPEAGECTAMLDAMLPVFHA